MLTLSPAALRDRQRINLSRRPETPGAIAFTAETLGLTAPLMDRARPLGDKGMGKLSAHLGVILAGIMRPGLQGEPVSFHRSSAGAMWEQSPIGRDRFCGIVDALKAAGLVNELTSTRAPGKLNDGRAALPPALWPTETLEALAARHGVTAGTRKADWRANPNEQAKAGKAPKRGVITCDPLDGVPSGLTPEMETELARLRQDLTALNAANGASNVLGAGHTVMLVRRFRHSLAFGGRFYGPIATMSPEDRRRITINGEAVAEVDVKASQLTVLLGNMGWDQAPLDAYALPGLPRNVAKAWTIQTLGNGRPLARWADRTPEAVRSYKIRNVKAAVLVAYPFLSDLSRVAPPVLMAGIPADKQSTTAGQWVVQREATIIARAMGELSKAGVVVLPVHDSLIVPGSAAHTAEAALVAAFKHEVGIVPRLTVETG